jgi:DNA-binding IclR family transcriptional regulator
LAAQEEKEPGVGLESGDGRASVADRVFLVLEACAACNSPVSLAELVDRTGLAKSTLHRICWKLVERGFLAHDESQFRLSTKLFALGSTSPDLRRLRELAMPSLIQLGARSAWAGTALLGVVLDHRALLVERVYMANAARPRELRGDLVPLHATSVGKALLAGQRPERIQELVGDGLLQPFTRNTIARSALLREQLTVIQRTGLAFSREEWNVGAFGVAAPIMVDGEAVAAGRRSSRAFSSRQRSISAHARVDGIPL